MATSVENKSLPDSQVVFVKKRKQDIQDYAVTKFGKSVIQVSVNREEERFDVLVREPATEIEARDFEAQWPMCKVEILKPIPRKK